MKYFHAETSSWKPFPSMARLVDVTKCICAEVVGNYLYVVVELKGSSHIMYRYDTVRNVWEELPRFQNDYLRVGCMSSVNEYIYVISDSGLLQRYSFAQNDWQSGSKLPFFNNTDNDQEKLAFVTAVRMRSKIYVLYGCYTRNNYGRRLSLEPKPAVVHCFDPLRNVWRKKASTRYPHFNSSLFVGKNNLYVAGGSVTIISGGSQGNMWASGGGAPVEVYNEGGDSWDVVKQNHIPSNNLGAVELLGGEVYFIINKFPIDSGIRIPPNEVYKISLRGWEKSTLVKMDSTAVLCYLSVNKEMLSTVEAAAK